MSRASRIDAIISKNTQAITYKRLTGASRSGASRTNTFVSYSIHAHFRLYRSEELGGLTLQGDREVRVAAAALSFTPKSDDKILIGSDEFNVVAVDTRVASDVPLLHIIKVRGNNGGN